MKRTLIASIFGIAASIANTHGQAQMQFVTYISSTLTPMVVYSNGQPVPGAAGLSAELLYGLGAGLSFNQLTPLPTSTTLVGALIPGSIIGGNVTLPDWISGPVTFGISILMSGQQVNYGLTWTEPASNIAPLGLPANQFTLSILQAAFPSVPDPTSPISLIVVPEPGLVILAGMGVLAACTKLSRPQ